MNYRYPLQWPQQSATGLDYELNKSSTIHQTYFYINFNIILPVSAYVYEVVPSVLLHKIVYTILISPMTLRRSEHSNQNGIEAIIFEIFTFSAAQVLFLA